MQRVAQLVFQTSLREFESLRRYQVYGDMRQKERRSAVNRKKRIVTAMSPHFAAHQASGEPLLSQGEARVRFSRALPRSVRGVRSPRFPVTEQSTGSNPVQTASFCIRNLIGKVYDP